MKIHWMYVAIPAQSLANALRTRRRNLLDIQQYRSGLAHEFTDAAAMAHVMPRTTSPGGQRTGNNTNNSHEDQFVTRTRPTNLVERLKRSFAPLCVGGDGAGAVCPPASLAPPRIAPRSSICRGESGSGYTGNLTVGYRSRIPGTGLASAQTTRGGRGGWGGWRS